MPKKMWMVRAGRRAYLPQESEKRGLVSLDFGKVTDLPKEEGRYLCPNPIAKNGYSGDMKWFGSESSCKGIPYNCRLWKCAKRRTWGTTERAWALAIGIRPIPLSLWPFFPWYEGGCSWEDNRGRLWGSRPCSQRPLRSGSRWPCQGFHARWS